MGNAKAPVAGQDIEAIIGGATLREAVVTLCLAGHLQGEYEDLERQLRDASSMVGQSLAGSPRLPIAERIEELRAEMAAHQVGFRLRALTPKAWSDLLAAHPSNDPGELFDGTTFFPAVVAACAVAPAMSVEQYQRLSERITHAQNEELLTAAWEINTKAVASVPFSLAASATVAGRIAGS
jgi:hypothetical protein